MRLNKERRERRFDVSRGTFVKPNCLEDLPFVVDITEVYFSITQAKAQLEELIRRAIQGEDVVICRRGVPVVRLVPVAKAGEHQIAKR